MAKETWNSVEVRVAREEDDEFFYLGINPFPGKEATKQALSNNRVYKPNTFYANDDGSVTIEWHYANLGFHKTERGQNFYKYVADLVVPQLEDAIGDDVVFDRELETIKLQLTEVTYTNTSSVFNVTRTRLGSMSLFMTEAVAVPIEEKVA